MQRPCDRAQLVEQNIEFVWCIVRQYLRRYPSVSRRIQIGDLANIGVLGMIAAGRHYDASRGVAFTTFTFPRIRGEISRAVARARLVRRHYQIAPLTDKTNPRQIAVPFLEQDSIAVTYLEAHRDELRTLARFRGVTTFILGLQYHRAAFKSNVIGFCLGPSAQLMWHCLDVGCKPVYYVTLNRLPKHNAEPA